MGGVADMGALRPDAIDRPSTRLPNAPTRLLLLSSLASRLAALGWGIGARGVCAHAYGRAGRHASAALYAPIDHPASSQHANSQAVLVSLLQSCTPAFILGVKRWEYLSYYRLLSKSSYSALQVHVLAGRNTPYVIVMAGAEPPLTVVAMYAIVVVGDCGGHQTAEPPIQHLRHLPLPLRQ